MALAYGVFVAGILQLAFQIPFLIRIHAMPRPRWSIKHKGVKRVMTLMLPAIFGSSVAQINGGGGGSSAAMLGGSAGEVSFTRDLGDLVLTVSGVTADEVVPVVRLDWDTQVRLRPSSCTSLGRQRAGT